MKILLECIILHITYSESAKYVHKIHKITDFFNNFICNCESNTTRKNNKQLKKIIKEILNKYSYYTYLQFFICDDKKTLQIKTTENVLLSKQCNSLRTFICLDVKIIFASFFTNVNCLQNCFYPLSTQNYPEYFPVQMCFLLNKMPLYVNTSNLLLLTRSSVVIQFYSRRRYGDLNQQKNVPINQLLHITQLSHRSTVEISAVRTTRSLHEPHLHIEFQS